MNNVIHAFETAINELLENCDSLSEVLLNKIPFEHSWTAGQIGDHLLKSYNSWTLLKSDTGDANRPIDEKCASLSSLFLNFDIKMKAEPSDFNYPSQAPIEKELLLKNILKTRDEIIGFARHHDLGVLCLAAEFPAFGHLTRLEWLHFHTVHTLRHLRQLNNCISSLNAA